MTQLLVDIGNTRIKWGLDKDNHIIHGQSLVHQQLEQNELLKCWKNISAPDRMAVSCVSSKQSLELIMTVARLLWPSIEIMLAQSKANDFGVRNAYYNPEKLGVDRWLSLIAVKQHYQGYTCIVDCGTAITIDVMDADGRHQGGLICPGLRLMKSSLATGTEILQFNQQKYPIGLANSTDAAIYTGTLWSVIGLIEHTMNKQPEITTLILTGGDAELIAEQLTCQPIIDSDLVLRGLALLLTGNQ
jgi:type III pantothenate kinase